MKAKANKKEMESQQKRQKYISIFQNDNVLLSLRSGFVWFFFLSVFHCINSSMKFEGLNEFNSYAISTAAITRQQQ